MRLFLGGGEGALDQIGRFFRHLGPKAWFGLGENFSLLCFDRPGAGLAEFLGQQLGLLWRVALGIRDRPLAPGLSDFFFFWGTPRGAKEGGGKGRLVAGINTTQRGGPARETGGREFGGGSVEVPANLPQGKWRGRSTALPRGRFVRRRIPRGKRETHEADPARSRVKGAGSRRGGRRRSRRLGPVASETHGAIPPGPSRPGAAAKTSSQSERPVHVCHTTREHLLRMRLLAAIIFPPQTATIPGKSPTKPRRGGGQETVITESAEGPGTTTGF